MDFNVHVTESGVEYNETIEVDTQKQTEVFKVPAHPGVDRSDVMHDFKQVGGSSFNLLTVVFSSVAILLFSSVAAAFAFNRGGLGGRGIIISVVCYIALHKTTCMKPFM